MYIQALNSRAVQLYTKGKYAEAIRVAERALSLADKALGPEHPDTLWSVNNLGTLYYTQGRYGEAESLYKRALAGREKALGAGHLDTLRSVNNLGLLYQAQGRYSDAGYTASTVPRRCERSAQEFRFGNRTGPRHSGR